MNDSIGLPTSVACRIVGMDPDSLNVHVSAGRFPCAPSTSPGRARHFDLDDMLALWLFRERLDREHNAKNAGHFACAIAEKARANPEAHAISVVQNAAGNRSVHVADDVPSFSDWGKIDFSGSPIHDVTTYNIRHIREIIAHRVEEEQDRAKC